jgi:RNA polymerase sigma-70 factor (ECF subfamily)
MAHIATGDPDEAMDLVQDAMLKLVHRYSGHDETEWPPLFHKILQSRIRDWYRRTRVRNRWLAWLGQRETDADQDDLLESAPDTGTPPSDERLARKRAIVALEAALRSLPFRQQQAFMLRAWEELDVAATARAMGCSEGSVKTHYFRAVHALRQLLKANWP